MDVDAAGEAATGALIAGSLEKPAGKAGAHNDGVCTDCGAQVSGNFCSNCGQATHVHRSLLHLVEEVLHGVLHFDARVWRTLPLLAFNPGRLTREWVEGRRTRYVSPLAIFLFTVFLIFFLMSFGGQQEDLTPRANAAAVAELRTELAEAKQARAELPADAPRGAVVATETVVRALENRIAQYEAGRTDGLEPGSWQAGVKDMAHDGAEQIKDKKSLGYKALHKLENPEFAVYKLKQTLYKFAFLLVPISIPFVALLFLWKPGFTLYDHGVFVLYSLTAMAILFTAMSWLARLPWVGSWFVLAAFLAAPVHMWAQLKGAYGLSAFSATWRTVALLIFCNVAVGLFASAIVMLGLMG